MKKVLYPLGVACFAMVVLTVTIHAMGNLPVKQADCSAKNVIKKTDGTCECKRSFVWEDAKSQCIRATTWCSKNYSKRSVYNLKEGQCECRLGQELNSKGDTCVKVVKATEVTLDDSDLQNGTGQYDFETGKKSVYGSPDLFISGIVFDGQWHAELDAQVVEMERPFKEVAQCPAEGYASVINVDPKTHFGTPIYANPTNVFCLKTNEGNFVKLEIISADYDSEKDMRVLKFKYILLPNGSRQFK
jgi:hypothetical protein